jgi:chromate transport protein ChrA
MDTISKFTFPGILLVMTLTFSFWLSSAGKPYSGLLFNAHKLIALGGVFYTGWQFSQWLKGADASPTLTILLVVAALSVLALFVSGGLLSAGKLDYVLMLTIHRIAPVVLVAGLGLGMVFLKSSP